MGRTSRIGGLKNKRGSNISSVKRIFITIREQTGRHQGNGIRERVQLEDEIRQVKVLSFDIEKMIRLLVGNAYSDESEVEQLFIVCLCQRKLFESDFLFFGAVSLDLFLCCSVSPLSHKTVQN